MLIDVEPLIVHCSRCGTDIPLGYLPMPLNVTAVVLKAAKCPRGHHRKFIAMGPMPKPTVEGDAMAWLANGDTGTSSLTIWHTLMHSGKTTKYSDVPYDPDDFGRCYRLLKVMPQWRARLSEVAARYPAWAPLVDAWDELTALYESEAPSGKAPRLYARMRQLRGVD